ncbi:MAG: hypothetical protein EAZ57_09470 [Cytophagales bacterium]|nr:MAG: hypothetical protein EAZ67_01500 [Cytophagales bacterium]TAF59867.1 MAG: hypothetical protein EAZ57_09470 [Cytophagales bacterium]
MTKVLNLFLVLFAAFVVFAGCTKNEVIDPQAQMSATVDVNGWNAKTINDGILSTVGGTEVLTLTGAGADGSLIILAVKPEVGTYPLSDPLSTTLLTYQKLTNTFTSKGCLLTASGNIEITSIDKEKKLVSGKFSGRVCNTSGISINITNGVLNNFKYR